MSLLEYFDTTWSIMYMEKLVIYAEADTRAIDP